MHLKPDELVDLAEGHRGDDAGAVHLRTCESCRTQVAALREALAAAAAVEVPEPSPLFWERLSARISEDVAAEGSPARAGMWAMPIRASWSAAAVAGVAIAVVVAIYVTAPRGSAPQGTEAAVASATPAIPATPTSPGADLTDGVLQPAGSDDDPSLAFVAELVQQMDPEAIAAPGWTNHAGAVEEIVTGLTDAERVELQRLLREALEKPDAS